MGALTHNGEVLQGLPADASQINFNKTGTNLNSTQTENAIKEVNTKVNTNTEDINQLKSGLTNLDDEILVYHKRYNGGDLWAGDTLTFNNIVASSNIVYHFVAFDTTATGTPESAYLIVKPTGVQAYGKVGTFTTAYDAEHETLTITLPSSSYWDYRFEVAARRND